MLVVAASCAGALLGSRVVGWATVDTTHLSRSFGAVGNPLTASIVRWDALAYLGIAAHGYSTKISTTFFPLYPVAIHVVAWLTRSDVAAGILISAVSFVIALVLLHRLTELELDRSAADATVLLLAFAPVALVFTTIYTESLFLALSVGAVYAARRGPPALAGVLAALAAVTRVTGVLLVVPIAMIWLRDQPTDRRRLTWLLLAPAALLGFLSYLAGQGYGFFAPLKNQVAHRTTGPIATIIDGLRGALHGVSDLVSGVKPYAPTLDGPFTSHADSLVLFVVLIVAVAALVLAFRRLSRPYAVYALLALVVVIFSETKIQPLEGLDRYSLTIFPLWMAAGSCLAQRRLVAPVVVFSAALLVFYSYQFATWAFVA